MVIIWHAESVNALEPETGRVLWSVPFESRYGLTAPTARLAGDILFLTAFYNGSLALRLGEGDPEILWQSPKATEKNRSQQLTMSVSRSQTRKSFPLLAGLVVERVFWLRLC
jgi:hypothetical protein